MIEKRLLELPDEIEKLRLNLLDIENGLLNNKEEIRKWELLQLDEIANEKDEKGKAVYSNDMKRKAELERRKTSDKDYIETEKIINCLEREIEIKKIKLDKLYSEQGNLRAICKLEGSLDG